MQAGVRNTPRPASRYGIYAVYENDENASEPHINKVIHRLDNYFLVSTSISIANYLVWTLLEMSSSASHDRYDIILAI